MEHAVLQADVPVSYCSKFREYGVDVLDGGSSFIELTFCPWCGASLPGSLRSEWFNRLEAAGIDPYEGKIPDEFNDERWYLTDQKK